MFADDVTFALDGAFNSFRELIDDLEAFKSVYGLKVNNIKNTVIRTGSLRNTIDENFKTFKLFMVIRIINIFRNSHFAESKKNARTKIVSEYDQDIPQSQTADNPVASRGRVAQPSRDTRNTN